MEKVINFILADNGRDEQLRGMSKNFILGTSMILILGDVYNCNPDRLSKILILKHIKAAKTTLLTMAGWNGEGRGRGGEEDNYWHNAAIDCLANLFGPDETG